MVFVDIDDFLDLINMCERDRPIGSDHLLIVDRALVVAVMQTAWSDQWVNFALIEPVNQRLNNDLDVVHLSFLEEGKASCRTVRQSTHDLVVARRVHAEDIAFDGIEDRDAIISLIFPEFVFHQLAVISRYWHWWKSLPERHVFPHDTDEASRQRATACGKRHQADRRQHDPAS